MTTARRSAVIAVTVWTLILAGLCAAVLAPGVEGFTDSDHALGRRLVAGLILIGLVLHFWHLRCAQRGRREGALDERDEAVARRASEATLIVVAVVVFAVSMALYTVHSQAGTVPVGWFYLMAYGSMALVSLVHAAATLVLDMTGAADG